MEAFCSGVNKVSRWGSCSFVPSCRPLTLTSRQSALHLGSLFVWFTSSQIHLKAIVLLWRIPGLPSLSHSRLGTAHTQTHTDTHTFTQSLLTLSLTHSPTCSITQHIHTHSAHLSWSDAGGRLLSPVTILTHRSPAQPAPKGGKRGREQMMKRRLRNKVKEN